MAPRAAKRRKGENALNAKVREGKTKDSMEDIKPPGSKG